jgi:transcriptional regulator with XRE-family HTH domain
MNRLRELRQAEGWSQARVVAAMISEGASLGIPLPGSTSLTTSLSRWENGRVAPGPEYRRILQRIFSVSVEELGFPIEAPLVTPIPNLPISNDVLEYFAALIEQHVAADNLLGSQYVAPLAEPQAQVLLNLVRQTRGKTRPKAVRMASRYQEFLGWLYQDAGRPTLAMRHTDLARDLATELDEQQLEAYLLMRKSNIALDAEEAVVAVSLADASITKSAGAHGSVRAAILRQKANSHAALGEASECAQAVDQALDAIAESGLVDNDDLAPYCTREYLAMESGKCWEQLGHADRALSAFGSVVEGVPSSRRDEALALARWASAHVLAGDVESACTVATRAVATARVTRSARMLRELRNVHRRLRRLPHNEAVEGLTRSINTLISENAEA